MVLPGKGIASHVFGGEIFYTHVTGNDYKISISLFGDCGTENPVAFNSLPSAYPTIIINRNNQQVDTIHLHPISGLGVEVTPICLQQTGNSKCIDPTSTLPGIKKFVYEKVYTLPSAAGNWSFVFDGTLNNSSVAGRSSNITNVANVSNQLMYLVATLNDQNGPNSSPTFTTVPTPFYCINIPQQYNQGAVDNDNDSLVYSLAPALNNGIPVTYFSSFSAVYPVSSVSQAFTLNPLNGQISFTPDITQNALVVNKVTEYKGGAEVGTCMREMSFIVLDNCQNSPPTLVIDSIDITGGSVSSGNIVNVCEGETVVSFNHPLADADGDTLVVTHTTLPQGANLNVSNNNTPNPVLHFNWNTSAVPVGLYTFFITLTDKHCPLSAQQTFGITIRIANGYSITSTITKPTNCLYRAVVDFTIANGITPRTVNVIQGGNIIRTITDTTGFITDSLAAGNYLIEVSSPHLNCKAEYTLEINHGGTFPFSPIVSNPVFCIGDAVVPLEVTPFNGATVQWSDLSGTPLPGAPVPNTTTPGVTSWVVSQQYLNCSSLPDTIDVRVAETPDVMIANELKPRCLGDKIFLRAEGAASIAWEPKDQLFYEPDSTIFIRMMQPVKIIAIGTNADGCSDSTSVLFDQIVPCCTFSYPSAFTPNNDGRNDSWHPLMHGNHSYYELSIFNRWGEKLFHSFTPNAGWDGYHMSRAQPMGTYFYYLKARCMTGIEEEHRGEIHLMR